MTFFGQPLTILEAIAAITGLGSVVLAALMHVLNWPVGIVSVVCYFVVFWDAKLYADAFLQAMFAGLCFWGWFTWSPGRVSPDAVPVSKPVLNITKLDTLGAVILTPLVLLGIGLILQNGTDSPVPWLDALIVSLSLLATFLQARWRIECWFVWMAVDVVAIPVYWMRALPLTAVLYAIFLCICIRGWRTWNTVRHDVGLNLV